MTLRFRLVRKLGEPLLLLPMESALARPALTLYPAQTTKARLARGLLGCGLRMFPGLVTAAIATTTDATSPFLKFLHVTAGTAGPPQLAMLLGNPRASGRRFVLLLFNNDGAPMALVKAGVGEVAMRLIASELSFLKVQPAALLHAPAVRGEFAADNLRAFAMDYVSGTTPTADDTGPVAGLMNAWLQPDRRVRFAELPVAHRLADALGGDPRWVASSATLREMSFHPALHHGDFAPWNVRVESSGKWRVLDWERGEAAGPPAWDWFHYVIQNEILVRRTPPAEVRRRVDRVLWSAIFQSYAARAGIVGNEHALLVAYLSYCVHVIRQADGLAAVEALLELVQPRMDANERE